MTPEQEQATRRREQVAQLWADGVRNKAELARRLNVGHTTIRRDCKVLGLGVGDDVDAGGTRPKPDAYESLEQKLDEMDPQDHDLKTLLEHVSKRQSPVLDDLKPKVFGLTPQDMPDPEKVLGHLIADQEKIEEGIKKRYNQVIELPDSKPVALVLVGDLHLGSPGVDYKGLVADTLMIRQTPGMYALGMGDYHDNWIGKLASIQRGQPISFEQELALLDWWFEKMDGSLVAVVAGNHDTGRSKKEAGIDLVKRILRGAQPVLYDDDEVVFDVKLGSASWRYKIRHKWMGSSIYNATHGIERDPRFGDSEFDIGVGAHTHRGTLFREFMFHGGRKLAVLCGTYKMHDRYALRLGFPRSPQKAATGALILWPDGRMETMHDLKAAAQFVKHLRGD